MCGYVMKGVGVMETHFAEAGKEVLRVPSHGR